MSVNKICSNRASIIQNCLANGKSREEIASLLGYKTWKSLDIYMRRTGAKWDSVQNTYIYVQKEHGYNKRDDIERIISDAEPKIASIISRFAQKTADPLQIAKECGFSDHRALSSHMKAKGYHWSVDINNYVDTPLDLLQQEQQEKDSKDKNSEVIPSNNENMNIQKYIPLLETLYKNRDRFLELVTATPAAGTIPRYTVPGITRTKSFYMSDKLSRLVTEFSEVRNISQKEIIEAAVIEFLRNHSFKEEIDNLLGRL